MNVLVDSCVFISFYDLDDSNHIKAINDLEGLTTNDDIIWITEHILDEIVSIFLRRSYKKQLDDFFDLIDKDYIRIFIPQNKSSFLELIEMTSKAVLSQKQKKASYTDLYSVSVVKSNFLSNCRVFSYDHHFKNI